MDIKVGDEVLVRGEMIRAMDGVGALVEFFSKTDQYQAWIRCEDVVEVRVPSPPEEPPNGTLLRGDPNDEGVSSVFHRDDREGHADRDRRYDRHWWDFAAQEWVDWPTTWRRGANPGKRLIEAP